MTLIEAIIAIAILAGIVATSLEVSETAIARSALARAQIRTAFETEALLRRASVQDPIKVGTETGVTETGVRYATTVVADAIKTVPEIYLITVDAQSHINGRTIQFKLSTIRLEWGTRP